MPHGLNTKAHMSTRSKCQKETPWTEIFGVYRALLPQKLILYMALVFGSFYIVLFTFQSPLEHDN